MPETTPQSIPTEPAPQVSLATGASPVVVPPELPKKGPGFLWLIVILAVAIVGWGAYFLYAQLQKPSEEVSLTPPSVVTQEGKPDQGFGSSSPTPAATPTLTSSDSVGDIEKDLSGTAIEPENTSEFDADLQSL